MTDWIVNLPKWAWRTLVVVMLIAIIVVGFTEKSDSAETPPTITITITVTHQYPAKRGEVIVEEQFLDNGGPLDVRQPAMLSYWPDLTKDDGTLSAAIFRCENQGGEMIAEFLEGDWVNKCEDVDY